MTERLKLDQQMDNNTILICEDDEEIAVFLETFLKIKGYNFVIVNEGSKVLPELKKGKVKLLLLDLGLPDMPGDKVVNQIRKEKDLSDIHIVYFSASSKLDKAMITSPADEVFPKPFDINELNNLIQRHVRVDG